MSNVRQAKPTVLAINQLLRRHRAEFDRMPNLGVQVEGGHAPRSLSDKCQRGSMLVTSKSAVWPVADSSP